MSSYKGATRPSQSFIFFKRILWSIFEGMSGGELDDSNIPWFIDHIKGENKYLLTQLETFVIFFRPHTYFILQKRGEKKILEVLNNNARSSLFSFKNTEKKNERKTFLIYYFWILIGKLLCKFFLPLAASLPIICSLNLVFDFKIGFISSTFLCFIL